MAGVKPNAMVEVHLLGETNTGAHTPEMNEMQGC